MPMDSTASRRSLERKRYGVASLCILYMYLPALNFIQARGLYKGVLPPLLMQATINAIVFGVQGPTSRYLTTTLKNREGMTAFLSGFSAGFAQSTVTAPMELVKLRVQNEGIGVNTRYKGNWATLRDIYQTEKVRGIYKGLPVTMLRGTVGYGVYFFFYESLMSISARNRQIKRDELSNIFSFVYGGCAGVLSWLVTFPIDTVKSRYQVDGAESGQLKYLNARDCLTKSMKEGGVRLLYNGLSTGLLRAFANSAFLFPAYEYSKRLLSSYS